VREEGVLRFVEVLGTDDGISGVEKGEAMAGYDQVGAAKVEFESNIRKQCIIF
jgi:hypothetical protein